MAEVQQNTGGGDGKKNKQKKQNLRVDFTPMVDMNMLLITFFMLCSTLLKPQTMNINMPSKDKVEEGQETKIAESTAITVILGAYDELFYYLGMPAEDGSDYGNSDFLQTSAYGAGGIRDLLIQRNLVPYEKINELKEQLANLEISDEQFREMSKEVQDKAIKEDKNAPTVMIKPTDLASYENMVNALDEMLICNIGAYTILDMSDGDRYLLYQKTGNLDYLTEEQQAELNN
jgi:Biopolymer transport protein ExbD/TolR.